MFGNVNVLGFSYTLVRPKISENFLILYFSSYNILLHSNDLKAAQEISIGSATNRLRRREMKNNLQSLMHLLQHCFE